MSIKKFIVEKLLKANNIIDIINDTKTPSEKGFAFEGIANILIKFNFLTDYFNENYNHIEGNVNNGKPKYITSLKNYIENNSFVSGNSGGVSDITLYNKNTDTYVFITSKFFKDDESKDVKSYDIQNIVSVIEDNKEIYKNFEIYILAKDKTTILKKASNSNSSSSYISKYISNEKIIDLKDLEKAFQNFKEKMVSIDIDSIDSIFMKNQLYLNLRFHQELIIRKTFNEIKHKKSKNILWGCKPRSGKTYMVGGLIKEDESNHEKFNILVITPAPTETSPQFVDDLFLKFLDFRNFRIHNIKSGHDLDNIENNNNKNIIIVSKQLMQNYIDNLSKVSKDSSIKLKSMNTTLKSFNFNYIFFDENHYGGTTDISKSIVESYRNENTVCIFLTATFFKTLNNWNIDDYSQFFWTMEDESFCKKRDIKSLLKNHGNYVKELIEYYHKKAFNDDDIFSIYEKMPELHILTSLFESARYEEIKERIKDTRYGFSMDNLLSLNKKLDSFNHKDSVETFLQYISGSKKEQQFKNGDKSIFGRIKEISLNLKSRTKLCNSDFTTQLWFLPFGIGNPINEVSKALKEIMLNDNILKKYEILILNSNADYHINDIKETVQKLEITSKNSETNKKDGLIILAGNMCSLGITLPLCDVVMLFNNILSSDKIYQMMMRSMTESLTTPKKCGFVVDLNTNRVLNTVLDYGIHNKELNNENKLKYLIENRLINIDDDYFTNKTIDSNKMVNKLLEIWNNDPVNHIKNILKRIENEIVNVDNEDQKILNKLFLKSTEENNGPQGMVNVNGEGQELPPGIIKKPDPDSEPKPPNNDTDSSSDDEEEKLISLTKDVLPFIIPLICFLTIKDNNKDLMQMLKSIKENPLLINVFDEQNMIWWNKKIFIEVIETLIKNNIKENSNIFNSTILIKMTIRSLIDKPDELFKFIQECLKPKKVEKEKFGEVFTPIELIDEMLDNLPNEVWSNPELKWLDLSNGMGNFMVKIYYRLMNGLKKVIPNEKQRKKHILENMLYMSEINKKNCFITKQIFDINNEYNLNIYEGDSLEMDTKKIWNVENFNIIIGNPPYNPDISEKKSKGQVIWHFFVKKSMDLLKDKGLLLFIHPPNWRKPKHELHDLMFNNIQYLKILDERSSEKFFHCKIRVDYYLLCKNNNKEYATIIDEKNIKYEMNIKKLSYIPNYGLTIHKKIMDLGIDKIICINPRTHDTTRKFVSPSQDEEHIYKLLNTNSSKGSTYYYSSKIHPVQNKNKVMFSNGRYIYPIYDNGTLGGTQSVLYIETENENTGNNLINFINSNIFKFLIKTTKFNNFAISHEFISIIGDLSKIIENINDLKINNYLKITEDENKLINDDTNNKKNDNDNTNDNESISSKSSKKSKEDKICCSAILKSNGLQCSSEAKYGEFCGKHKAKNIEIVKKK